MIDEQYNPNIMHSITTFDSSVGRAVDCSMILVIHRSLVRLRLEGLFYKFISSTFLLLKTYKSKINSLFQSLECKVAFVYERSNLYLKKNLKLFIFSILHDLVVLKYILAHNYTQSFSLVRSLHSTCLQCIDYSQTQY